MKKKGLTRLLIIVLVATASWALYRLINSGISDLLAKWGITSEAGQAAATLLGIAVILIVLLGMTGGQKAIMKIIEG